MITDLIVFVLGASCSPTASAPFDVASWLHVHSRISLPNSNLCPYADGRMLGSLTPLPLPELHACSVQPRLFAPAD